MSRLLLWILALSSLWFVLTRGDLASWSIGIPFIALAVIIQRSMFSAHPPDKNQISIPGLLQFLYFFCVESIRGGIDVSQRVLVKKPRVEPLFYDYQIKLQQAVARQFFINTISLLPGTLCADWNNNIAHIHALDSSPQILQGIKTLELKIAGLFGEKI
jgi:multicomponent Na+:H+ antiporter subunit E